MEVQFWATTDTGLARDHNEDNFLVDRDLSLFVVCDGMGGHAAGEVASAMSIQVISEIIAENRDILDAYEREPSRTLAQDAVLDLMDTAITEACRRIFEAAEADPDRHGMGTTCCALLLLAGRGFVGHVGDSRIYHIRDGDVDLVTMDHSFLNEMIRQGRAKEGDSIPNQNAVTRAVGVRPSVEVDTFDIEVEQDDLFIICSDGLSGYFESDEQILGLIDPDDLEGSTYRCIEHALRGGGRDNITTILARVDRLRSPRRTVMDSETLRALKACDYFAHATPSEFSQLCDIAERHHFEAGEDIIEPNRPAEFLCLVINGSVGITGDKPSATVLDAGDTFGEVSLFGESKSNEGYTALAPTRLVVFQRDALFGLLRARPSLAAKVLFGLAANMAEQLRRVPAELRFEPQLWDEVSIHSDHTPAPGFMVINDNLDVETRSMPGLSPAQAPAPASKSTPPPRVQSPPKGSTMPPLPPSAAKAGAAAPKKSKLNAQKRPLPPRPTLPPELEDDIETQQNVDLDELRKTTQFDRFDAKFDKL
ncbi:serine/threonine protein phosphatase PrpC [Bradymonas sediminis]|nr:serine/threonine protein phosphatase PrpC [Bradymonas sediminis]